MLDVIAACGRADKLVDFQQRKIVFKRGSFAVGRQRDLPTLLNEGPKYVADTIKGLHAMKILLFIDRALRLEDIFPFGLVSIRHNKLKRLIAIEAGIKLKCVVWHLMAEAFKRLLQALQGLRYAVYQSAFNVENEACKHRGYSGSTMVPQFKSSDGKPVPNQPLARCPRAKEPRRYPVVSWIDVQRTRREAQNRS